jgi:hypothetical protein
MEHMQTATRFLPVTQLWAAYQGLQMVARLEALTLTVSRLLRKNKVVHSEPCMEARYVPTISDLFFLCKVKNLIGNSMCKATMTLERISRSITSSHIVDRNLLEQTLLIRMHSRYPYPRTTWALLKTPLGEVFNPKF